MEEETGGGVMPILVLKPNGFVLPSIHDSMVRAFRSLGVEVFDLLIPKGPKQFQSFIRAAKSGYEAVFTLDLGADSVFMSYLKNFQISLRIPWIIWFADDPEGYGFPEVCEPAWTLPFCWDREIAQEQKSWNGLSMTHLPLATDPSVFYPGQNFSGHLYPGGVFVGSTAHPNEVLDKVAQTTPGFSNEVETIWEAYRQDFRKSLYTLAWACLAQKINQPIDSIQADPLCRLWVKALVYKVGMKKRQELVSWVLKPGGVVFGDEGWRGAVGEGLYRGQVAYGDELQNIYRKSAFVLDIRQPQSRTGLTQRVFDASACGVPVLTEWSPELEALFDPENELLCFKNLEEAVEMKNRYLKDRQEARKKGEKARRRVLAHHTYLHRARQILEAVNE